MADNKIETNIVLSNNIILKESFIKNCFKQYFSENFFNDRWDESKNLGLKNKLKVAHDLHEMWQKDINKQNFSEEISKFIEKSGGLYFLCQDDFELVLRIAKNKKESEQLYNAIEELLFNTQDGFNQNAISDFYKFINSPDIKKYGNFSLQNLITSIFIWMYSPKHNYIVNQKHFEFIAESIDENYDKKDNNRMDSHSIEDMCYFYELHNKVKELLNICIKENNIIAKGIEEYRNRIKKSELLYDDEELTVLVGDICYSMREYLFDENNIENNMQIGITNLDKGENFLYYGIPGCGKSYMIKEMLKNKGIDANSKYVERVVFYPDYSYSDFVGAYLPQQNDNDKLIYPFVEGPFTRILERAINDSKHNYYLIIEELNRGNAPAIFGDIFQLLDRDKTGRSEYEITNKDIFKYIKKKNNNWNDDNKIFIPNNLLIYATMNTSDQNIFSMDTAFQRRWNMQLISNVGELEDFDLNAQELLNSAIIKYNGKDCTTIKWFEFRETINQKIADLERGVLSTNDKRLGIYFIQKEDFEITYKNGVIYYPFLHKVLKYLWDDVFRAERDNIFNVFKNKNENKTLKRTFEDIVLNFNKIEYDNKDNCYDKYFEDILNDETYRAIIECRLGYKKDL